MPTEEGRRGDEEGDPGVTRDDPTRRREEDPVDGPELERARRPLQHPELMVEDEDLEILGSVGSTRLSSAYEETDEGADDEVEEGRHRPIVPGLSERDRGFRPPRALNAPSRAPEPLRARQDNNAVRPLRPSSGRHTISGDRGADRPATRPLPSGARCGRAPGPRRSRRSRPARTRRARSAHR